MIHFTRGSDIKPYLIVPVLQTPKEINSARKNGVLNLHENPPKSAVGRLLDFKDLAAKTVEWVIPELAEAIRQHNPLMPCLDMK